MADYYVATDGDNGDPGSLAEPWLTLTYALTQLAAGDTLYVRVGTYSEALNIATSGSVGSPITISAYQSEAVIIDGGASPAVLCETNADYYTWVGITFKANGEIDGVYSRAVYHNRWVFDDPDWIEGAITGWQFTNCKCLMGSLMVFGPGTIIDGCEVDGTDGDYIGTDGGGIIVRGAVAADAQVKNCNVHDWKERGIWVLGVVDDPLVQGNAVTDIANGDSGSGMGIDIDAYGETGGTSGAQVLDNTVTGVAVGIGMENAYSAEVKGNTLDTCTKGIEITAYDAERGVDSESLAANNLFVDCHYDVQINSAAGWDFLCNTAAGHSGANPKVFFVDYEGTPAYIAGTVIKGNVFDGDFDYAISIDDTDGVAQITADYNCYNAGDICEERDSWGNWDLADWQAAGQGAHSLDTDPLFVGGGDYALAVASPCRNASVDLGIYEDIDGNVRPSGGGYDLGAYQKLALMAVMMMMQARLRRV